MAHLARQQPCRDAKQGGEMRLPIQKEDIMNELLKHRRRRRLLVLCLVMMPLLAGCASNPPPAEIAIAPMSPAKIYKYITWSKADTPKTIDQIRRHNARHWRMLRKSNDDTKGS